MATCVPPMTVHVIDWAVSVLLQVNPDKEYKPDWNPILIVPFFVCNSVSAIKKLYIAFAFIVVVLIEFNENDDCDFTVYIMNQAWTMNNIHNLSSDLIIFVYNNIF